MHIRVTWGALKAGDCWALRRFSIAGGAQESAPQKAPPETAILPVADSIPFWKHRFKPISKLAYASQRQPCSRACYCLAGDQDNWQGGPWYRNEANTHQSPRLWRGCLWTNALPHILPFQRSFPKGTHIDFSSELLQFLCIILLVQELSHIVAYVFNMLHVYVFY